MSYQDTTIEPLVPYQYEVTAVDTYGNESEKSEVVTGVGYMPKILSVSPVDYACLGGSRVRFLVRFKDFGNSIGNTVNIEWKEQWKDIWTPVCNQALTQTSYTKEILAVSYMWDISEFTGERNIDVRVTVTDEDGNMAEQQLTYYMDRTGRKSVPDLVRKS